MVFGDLKKGLNAVVNSALTPEQKAALKAKAREEVREEVEEMCVKVAPWYISCFFCCCGGPIGTVDKFTFVVPEKERPHVEKGIKKYYKIMGDDDVDVEGDYDTEN